MFPTRYKLKFSILFGINWVFKGLKKEVLRMWTGLVSTPFSGTGVGISCNHLVVLIRCLLCATCRLTMGAEWSKMPQWMTLSRLLKIWQEYTDYWNQSLRDGMCFSWSCEINLYVERPSGTKPGFIREMWGSLCRAQLSISEMKELWVCCGWDIICS
jgi:hypothetical protein